MALVDVLDYFSGSSSISVAKSRHRVFQSVFRLFFHDVLCLFDEFLIALVNLFGGLITVIIDKPCTAAGDRTACAAYHFGKAQTDNQHYQYHADNDKAVRHC